MFHWLLLDIKGHWEVISAFISGMIELDSSHLVILTPVYRCEIFLFCSSYLLWTLDCRGSQRVCQTLLPLSNLFFRINRGGGHHSTSNIYCCVGFFLINSSGFKVVGLVYCIIRSELINSVGDQCQYPSAHWGAVNLCYLKSSRNYGQPVSKTSWHMLLGICSHVTCMKLGYFPWNKAIFVHPTSIYWSWFLSMK